MIRGNSLQNIQIICTDAITYSMKGMIHAIKPADVYLMPTFLSPYIWHMQCMLQGQACVMANMWQSWSAYLYSANT